MYKHAHHPLQAPVQGFVDIIIIITIPDVCPACVCMQAKSEDKIKCSHSDKGNIKKAGYTGDIYLQFPAVQRFYSAAGSQRHLPFPKADLLDCPVILFLPLYFPSTA